MEEYELEIEIINKDGVEKSKVINIDLADYNEKVYDYFGEGDEKQRRKEYIDTITKKVLKKGEKLTSSKKELCKELDEALNEYLDAIDPYDMFPNGRDYDAEDEDGF